MYSVEDRYKEYQNGERLSLSEIHDLLLDNYDLMDYYFAHQDDYSHIGAINTATDIDNFINDYLDAADEATDKIFNLTNLSDSDESITLFRGVELGPDEVEPDMTRPGMCWTFDYATAQRFVEQFDDANNPDFAPCILTAQFKAKDIDWLYSVACMLDEPDENEIRIFKDSKPIAIDYEVL